MRQGMSLYALAPLRLCESLRLAFLAVSALTIAAIAAPAAAQDASWSATPGSGDLNTGSNWSTSSVPGASNTASFDTSAITALTLAAPAVSMGAWTFNSGASVYTATISGGLSFTQGGVTVNGGSVAITADTGGSVSFAGHSSAGTAQLIANAGGTVDFSATTGPSRDGHVTAGSIAGAGNYILGANTLTVGSDNTSTAVSGVISGTGGSLTKIGLGTLILSGANTYSGGTVVSSSLLQVTNNSAVGTGAVTLDNGQFQAGVDGLTFGNKFAINKTPSGSAIDSNGYTLTIAGNIVDGNGPGQLNVDSSGGGTVVFTGANTYSGGTNICACATLQLGTLVGRGSIIGVVSNEGGTFNIVNADTSGITSIANDFGGQTQFFNATTAGTATIVNKHGGATVFGNSGGSDTASADHANITNSAGGSTTFQAMTTAGSASITNQNSSQTLFLDSSTAGSASITNDGGQTLFGVGGPNDSASAGSATIVNKNSGVTLFVADTSGGNATIVNGLKGTTIFADFGTAANANITTNADGTMVFLSSSTAGNATIATNSGGQTLFFGNSTGGLAQFITNGTGFVDFSGSLGPNTDGQISAGSIAGSGSYFIGAGNTLTVGGNNLSTEVSGVIADVDSCGCSSPGPGALVKIGTGTMILSGVNTYSGGTTFAGGTVSVSREANLGDPAGALTFNGGTLQVTGTSFTATTRSITWGAGGGGFDIADPGNVFTVGQTLTGGGPLAKLGAGTLVLGGSNSYSGGTTVSGGTLAISADNNIGTGPLALQNGTTLKLSSSFVFAHAITVAGDPTIDVAAGNVNTLAGVIADGATPGDIVKTGAGTLISTANNTYSGGTTISAGTLALSGAGSIAASAGLVDNGIFDISATTAGATLKTLSGTGSVVLGAQTLSLSAAHDTFAGVISGSGGFVLAGGSETLTGASTYSGGTLVSGGRLVVDGSIASSAVTVANGAVLGGKGAVGSLVAQSGATVAPGVATPFTTLNVAGNVTFAAGSTFLVNVNAAGQTDKLAATGTATLSGGTVQVLAGSGLYSPLSRYTILTAAGGVSGTFAQLAAPSNFTPLTLASNFAFLTPSLSYDANDVYLGFTQTTSFPSVAITRNQAGTASAVQALGLGNPIFNAVLNQGVPGARQAFDALSGEIHASAVTAAFEDNRLPREAILDRLSQTADVPVLGAATTMTGAYAADLPSGKHPNLAPVEVRMVQPRMFGVWGQGFGDWGTTDGDHNAAKLSRNTGGFILGADTTQTLGWSGVWRLGIAGGYTDDRIKVSARSSSGDYQSIFGALYGGASYGAFDLKLGAIAATTNTHTNRSIAFPMYADSASASYGGYAVQAFGEAGYRLPYHWSLWSYVPGLESLSVTYEPFLQAAVIHIGQNRYAETAFAGAGLVGSARDYDLGTTTLGLRSEYRLASAPGFTLRTMLGWRYAFGDVKPSVTQAFAGSLGSFTVAGVPIDRNALVTETNLDYAVSSAVTVGLSYAGQLGSKASDSTFKGNLDVKF
ncbi:outer membrane autotransporter barrel domain-containing protein [Rhizobiales bacterium GAS191]|nr:outer membrane autotransporter barrel domain-containing protein [Rhizobiales bacterium GAS191]